MTLFHGHDYNYDASPYLKEPHWDFRNIFRAGEAAPDFTLPRVDGGEVTLSDLRGKPVLIEFGSIT
ncbi:MAG: redoxin domain-containing protein [Chloroflexi bacterium]|nr:redoxin domain-containing protein [Chloroflexota bacterium]MCH7654412.1 redoxin domain-containing protein [Chloroflexota bacterium]